MRRLLAACAVAAVCLLTSASAASAADSVLIRELNFSEFPQVRISALVTGETPDATEFALRENGRIVPPGDFTVVPIAETETPIGIVLVVDTSGSMRAQNKLGAAKAAAKQFVSQMLPNDQVAIVTFNNQPQVVSGFTSDRARLDQAIDGLQAVGETALFDGVRTAAALLTERPELQANIVLLSDGADTVSQNGVDEAQAAVLAAKAALFSVGLRGGEFDAASLSRLATSSGGKYTETTDATELTGLYGNIQRALQNQYEISYTSTADGSVEIDLAVAGARTSAGPANPGVVSRGTSTSPAVVKPSRFAELLEGKGSVLFTALIVAGGAALLVFGAVAIARRERSSLDATLEGYGPIRAVPPTGGSSADMDLAQTAVVRRAVEATARLASERGVLQAVEQKLEQADLPVRPAEALFFFGATVAVSGVIGLLLAGLFGAFIALFFVGLVPVAVLNVLASRRQRQFTEQLPDMLQLLASTLRAGYSLLQGAEAVTEQVGDPMGKELRRVLGEARLGRPLERALEDSAKRIRSNDYDWAVMAIGIQREVGGNLAELLQTVAETMVARERLRREVRTLTAEGRISAIVLGILPIAIGAVVYALNPDYLEPLFTRTAGKMLVVGALIFGVGGFLWMKKIITIET